MPRSLGVPLSVVMASVMAACAGSGSAGSPPLATSGPMPTPPQVERSFPADRTIAIELGERTIERDGRRLQELALKSTEEYLFRVTNDNAVPVDHNFYIGFPTDLAERRLVKLTGVPVFSSGTAEFTYVVPDTSAELQFACTLFEHYATMHGTVTIVD